MWKFLEPIWTVRDRVWTVWVPWVMIYAINCVLVCMGPEMAMEFGSTKRDQRLVSGLPTDSQPTVMFLGLLKIVPGLCELDQKRPYVVCMKLFEMNGLSWLIKEINRLMFYVLK